MTVHRTEHRIVVDALPPSVYQLVADVTLWPAIFGPTVYVRHLEKSRERERFQIWALVNGSISSWSSRRTLDEGRLSITFRQEASRPPIASMGGDWNFRALSNGRTEVTLRHDFTSTDDDEEQIEWIMAALDRNSSAELADLARIAGPGVPADQVVFSFEDVVEVHGTAASAYEFIHRADWWPERLPHVRQVELTGLPEGAQLLEMSTVTEDGSSHATRSFRICAPREWIAYKQEVTPALLTGHSGLWTFEDSGASGTALVTARHTVAVDPAAVTEVLGAGRTLADARKYVRSELGSNSKATLAHAAAHARPAA